MRLQGKAHSASVWSACRRVFLFIFFYVWFTHAYASPPPKHLSFKPVLPEQISTIGDVQAIAQDQLGFMWFGGRSGLVKYDGYALTHYKTGENGRQSGLESKYINDIFLSRSGDIWVATHSGLHRYNPNLDILEDMSASLRNTEAEQFNHVRGITEDAFGNLWLATHGGLMSFNMEERTFKIIAHPGMQTRNEQYFQNITIDNQGVLWLGSKYAGLVRYDPKSTKLTRYKQENKGANRLKENNITAVYFDGEETVWVGAYRSGLYKINTATLEIENYSKNHRFSHKDIGDIIKDAQGRLWIAHSFGVQVLNTDTHTMKMFRSDDTNPASLPSDKTRALFIDRSENLWIGSYPSGISLLDRQASIFVNYYPNPKKNSAILGGGVRNIHEDRYGHLWIATGLGVSHIDRTKEKIQNYSIHRHSPSRLSGSGVLDLEADDDSNLFISYWEKGVDKLNMNTGEVLNFTGSNTPKEHEFKGVQPWVLLNDRDGTLWIATELGLNRYNPSDNSFTYFRPANSIFSMQKRFYIRAMIEDSEGRIWLGSSSGLFLFNKETGKFRVFRRNSAQARSLKENYVISIFEDSKGKLWVGTKGGGLHRMDSIKGYFTNISTEHGLPGNIISSISEDEQNNLWITTHNGLAKYNISTGRIETYKKLHGLPGNLFNKNTLTKLSDGHLAAGTSTGLTVFNPKRLSDNVYAPPIVITDFTILNRSVPINNTGSPLTQAPVVTDSITLRPEHSVFTFHFSALNYHYTEDNQYTYILKGFDKDWQYIGNQRSATYTNLHPGKYVFSVKGSNNSGVWSQEERSINIEVLPPLWATWWAYLIYAIMTLLFIITVILFFIKKQAYTKEKKVNQKLLHVDRLKDELLAHTSHELRTPLNGIIGLSEVVLADLDRDAPKEKVAEAIKMILFSGRRLSRLVDDILDFSKLKSSTLSLKKESIFIKPFMDNMIMLIQPLIGSKNVLVENEITDPNWRIYADEKRLEQIFFNLLGNAVKFTYEGKISVHAKLSNTGIVIEVRDSGVGISEEHLERIFDAYEQVEDIENHKFHGTGLGLAITKRLVELHDGAINVKSQQDIGTQFYLHLPNAEDISSKAA